MNRRNFLSSAAIIGGASAAVPLVSCQSNNQKPYEYPDYSDLDKILQQPILKKELFPHPIIIDKLELLQNKNNFICRVRSKDGAEGISIGHPFISKQGFPMFKHGVYRHFINKDARNLDLLVFNAAERNVKKQGVPLCVQIATVEFAILDMLGNIANQPVGRLIGDIHHPEISIYLGTRLRELRKEEPHVSLELVHQDWQETKAKAIKLRAGRGDNLGSDIDNAPGRTEKLIKMAREKFGDEMVLMIDGNGSYSVKEAIRIGKMLEEYNYYFYEEPLPWDWYEEQKQVADAMTIPMAGGEEEFGMHAFRWLIANNAFEILQPDLFYFGGMIRSMQVARMAAARGKTVAAHMSSGGLGYLYMLHFTSACPNADKYHEFKMFATKDANKNTIPIESKTEPFSSIDGIVKVPTGSGLGISIDPDYIKTHKVIYQ
ncbi:MAG: mandelate racemase/muconate lactonizing enzyme family protein [Bacteroidales bacterium]|nr:mandelate racemase/muconate lactonizing enzyme family protein [Bacteroidales bacterium]